MNYKPTYTKARVSNKISV